MPVGLSEAVMGGNTQRQEKADKRLEELTMGKEEWVAAAFRRPTYLSGSRYLKPPALPEVMTTSRCLLYL